MIKYLCSLSPLLFIVVSIERSNLGRWSPRHRERRCAQFRNLQLQGSLRIRWWCQWGFARVEETVGEGSYQRSFDIPPGTYAIKLHIDENENGELDTNFLGIPREQYGTSNNLLFLDFEAASFVIDTYEKVQIDLWRGRYLRAWNKENERKLSDGYNE